MPPTRRGIHTTAPRTQLGWAPKPPVLLLNGEKCGDCLSGSGDSEEIAWSRCGAFARGTCATVRRKGTRRHGRENWLDAVWASVPSGRSPGWSQHGNRRSFGWSCTGPGQAVEVSSLRRGVPGLRYAPPRVAGSGRLGLEDLSGLQRPAGQCPEHGVVTIQVPWSEGVRGTRPCSRRR